MIFAEFENNWEKYQIVTEDRIVFQIICDGEPIGGLLTALEVISKLAVYANHSHARG